MTERDRSLKGAAFLEQASVRRVLGLLNADGEEARVVGGAVRNTLMGIPVADIDIATTALPSIVMMRAKAAGIHAVPTGFEHGTVTLVVGGVPHEVTTLREDIETNGRHAVVRFGRDFAQDALRRDFTINALSVEANGTLHDYADGLADFAARRVRFIGDAELRIREDFLRILRFFRFSASYGNGTLESEGLAAVERNKAGLDGLSRERIRQEMMKLLVAPHAGAIVKAMAKAGILQPVLGGNGDAPRLQRLIALESALGLQSDPVRRLEAMAVTNAADVKRLRERLRLTNAELARLEAIVAFCGGFPAADDLSALKEILYRAGRETYLDVVLCVWSRTDASLDSKGWHEAFALPDHWISPRFVLTGKDVMALGIPAGPRVGQILSEVQAAWTGAGMPESEAAQRAILEGVGQNR